MPRPWWKDQGLLRQVRDAQRRGVTSACLAEMVAQANYPKPKAHSVRAALSKQRTAPLPEVPQQVRAMQRTQAAKQAKKLESQQASSSARWQTLLDMLDARTAQLTPRTSVGAVRAPERGDLCLLFPLTDPHTGGFTSAAEAGARFAFDSERFTARFARWEEQVLQFIARMQLLGRVPYISIPSLGDVIENALMRPGADQVTDMENVEAVVLFADLLAQLVQRLVTEYPRVQLDLEFLDGNHDRITEQKGTRPSHESWTGVAYALVTRMLRQFAPRVRCFRHTEPSALISVGGTEVLLYHGHGISGGGLPHKQVEAYAERFVAYHRRRFQAMIIGHFHHAASWTSNGGIQIVMCPAFADSSSYAAGLSLANRGMQKALVFESGIGLTYDYPLYLGAPIPESPVHVRWSMPA